MTVFRVPMSTRTRPWRVVWRTSFGLPLARCFESHAQAIRWATQRAAGQAAQHVTQRDYGLASGRSR